MIIVDYKRKFPLYIIIDFLKLLFSNLFSKILNNINLEYFMIYIAVNNFLLN